MRHDEGEVVEVLVRARALIADPQTWTQGALARAADGSKVSFDDPTAVQWCASGAVAKVCGHGPERQGFCTPYRLADRALNKAACRLGGLDTGIWYRAAIVVNDSRGHSAVMEMFEAAIAGE